STVPRGECAGRRFEFRRSHVVCRCVDEVSREAHAFDGAGDVGGIDSVRDCETHVLVFFFAITGEPIGSKRKSERCQSYIVRCIGKPIGAGGQQSRQLAGQKKILVGNVGRFRGKQPPGERPVWPGQRQVPTCLRREGGRFGEGARLRGQLAA